MGMAMQLQRLLTQDHTAALDYVLQHLADTYSADISKAVEAVGHRVCCRGTLWNRQRNRCAS